MENFLFKHLFIIYIMFILHSKSAIPTYLLDNIKQNLNAKNLKFLKNDNGENFVKFAEINLRQQSNFDQQIIPLLLNENSSRSGNKLSWAFLPENKNFDDFKLFAFDMDSTLITCECIDELADFAGCKDQVAQITEEAMQGKLSYPQSLRKRLHLLAGLDSNILQKVYQQRIHLQVGIEFLLEQIHNFGLRSVILSGGFTYFTERLRIEYGFDFATSNELEIIGGKITGNVLGEIIDAQVKQQTLQNLANQWNINLQNVMVFGDGANDLAMMKIAGLSVGIFAKESVQKYADVIINDNNQGHKLLFEFFKISNL